MLAAEPVLQVEKKKNSCLECFSIIKDNMFIVIN